MTARVIGRTALAVAMIAVGLAHFAMPEPFMRIVPPWLPAPRTLVYVSGVYEVAGGVGLLVPRTRRAAAWALIALFVAVFPANVYMAVAGVDPIPDQPVSEFARWARLPLQALLIAWAALLARGPTLPAGARHPLRRERRWVAAAALLAVAMPWPWLSDDTVVSSSLALTLAIAIAVAVVWGIVASAVIVRDDVVEVVRGPVVQRFPRDRVTATREGQVVVLSADGRQTAVIPEDPVRLLRALSG